MDEPAEGGPPPRRRFADLGRDGFEQLAAELDGVSPLHFPAPTVPVREDWRIGGYMSQDETAIGTAS